MYLVACLNLPVLVPIVDSVDDSFQRLFLQDLLHECPELILGQVLVLDDAVDFLVVCEVHGENYYKLRLVADLNSKSRA